jgi:hypothetical protein
LIHMILLIDIYQAAYTIRSKPSPLTSLYTLHALLYHTPRPSAYSRPLYPEVDAAWRLVWMLCGWRRGPTAPGLRDGTAPRSYCIRFIHAIPARHARHVRQHVIHVVHAIPLHTRRACHTPPYTSCMPLIYTSCMPYTSIHVVHAIDIHLVHAIHLHTAPGWRRHHSL